MFVCTELNFPRKIQPRKNNKVKMPRSQTQFCILTREMLRIKRESDLAKPEKIKTLLVPWVCGDLFPKGSIKNKV